MKEEEAVKLFRQALNILRNVEQENGNITVEVRRGEPKHVRVDLEVKPTEENRL